MATNTPTTESGVLEQSRIALENTKNQPVIAATMDEYEYPPEKIAVGNNLCAETVQIYNKNKTEDDETSAASQLFKTKRAELAGWYKTHVRKTRSAFRNDPVTKERLGIIGRQPGAYAAWIFAVKKIYTEVNADEAIKAKIVRLKTPVEEFTTATNLVAEIEAARAEYLREVSESEDTTKQKDAAFVKLEDWMSEFYEVARIALEDHSQLLEALGL